MAKEGNIRTQDRLRLREVQHDVWEVEPLSDDFHSSKSDDQCAMPLAKS